MHNLNKYLSCFHPIMGVLERINEIEAEMARTQKNKATEYHMGCLKARIAKLRRDLAQPRNTTSGVSFEVQKSGDARVALIGLPSVGKSTLLSILTNANSQAGDYDFTTLDCVPGRMIVNDAKIQILDLPGIIKGASSGIGRGKQVLSVARTADLILMVLDPRRDDRVMLTEELYAIGIRINKKKPKVSITLTNGGGVCINTSIMLTKTNAEMIKVVLKEYKINNCQVVLREDVEIDDVIDVICGGVVYIPCLFCYNKIDSISLDLLDTLADRFNSVVVSSRKGWNLDELRCQIWEKLGLTRVYTKRKGEKPDLDNPIVVRQRRVKDVCDMIHRDLVAGFKYAMVWGSSVKHVPQKVGLNHVLDDEDVVQVYSTS